MTAPHSMVSSAAAAAAAALDLVLPAICAGCGQRGEACCPSCLQTLAGRRSFVHTTGACVLAPYDDIPRTLVLAHKERGRRDLTRPLGRALATAVPHLPDAHPDRAGRWWLVPVPSRRSAARARGGSHVLALARRCAVELAERDIPATVAPVLSLDRGARDAVGLDHAQRMVNLEGRIRLRHRRCPAPGTPVLLLDDIVTTGATLDACARVLARVGVDVTAGLALTGA